MVAAAPKSRARDPIKRVDLRDGSVRYEFVIDLDRDETGRRQQKRYRFATKKKAQAERARIISERAQGTFVAPTELTVGEYLPAWLAGKRNLRPSTRRVYGDCLKPVVERLGDIELQKLSKLHLDVLVDWMLVAGRRVGNIRRQGVSPRTVNLMLGYLSQALDSAMKQGLVARNVAKLVERPTHVAKPRQTWTIEQAQRFLEYVAEDRLYACWRMTMFGLRRGEICGLRWDDLDLDGDTPTVTIRSARVSVAGVVMESAPKSANSSRVLPLDEESVGAFRDLRAMQDYEAREAGPAYEASGFVAVDELGRAYRPEWYGDEFQRLAGEAGVSVIPLHAARHTCGTLMHLRGVPVAVIAAWLGHASASFTMATYVHSQNPALVGAGSVLAGALGRVVTPM